MKLTPILSLALLPMFACSSPPPVPDVSGPYLGTSTRYAIDRLTLPADSNTPGFADDLNGDHVPDDALGFVTRTLGDDNDITTHANDMIAAGVVASAIVITQRTPGDDSEVGLAYIGADGEPAPNVGAAVTDGVIESNRSQFATDATPTTLHLPLFADADPSILDGVALEYDLTPDGSGGYDGFVRGGLTSASTNAAAALGLVQMIDQDPQMHLTFARLLDADHAGVVTAAEVTTSATIQAFLQPDLELVGESVLSFAFQIHLQPCAAAPCAIAAPADTCHDRVRDGDETDVDCGGTCGPCPPAAMCAIAGDCQTGACTGGTCAAATCTDGVLDGFESAVDCGDACGGCLLGEVCYDNDDCASTHCTALINAGVCEATGQ